jgi:hypothetical protein
MRTDNRDFGGGSRRVGFQGTIRPSDLGSLESKGNLFTHDTSGSEHVRWVHTGYLTSKGEIGSVDGPTKKSAPVTSSEKRVDDSVTESTLITQGSAGYPFVKAAPDIDYKVKFVFKQDPAGPTAVRFEITNNLFPYYELLIKRRNRQDLQVIRDRAKFEKSEQFYNIQIRILVFLKLCAHRL